MMTPRAVAPSSWQTPFGMLGLAMIMLAIGQSYLLRKPTADQGKILFLLGLVLTYQILCRHSIRQGQECDNEGIRPQSIHLYSFRHVAGLFTLAGAFAFLSAVYATRPQLVQDTALLWIAGMGLFVVALLVSGADLRLPFLKIARIQKHITHKQLIETIALVAIIALALYLRAFDLKDIPRFVHGDEAHFGLDAHALRDGKVRTLFENGFQEMPRLSMLPAALIMKAWNDGLGSLRLASVLTGILTLPFLYLLARLFVDRGPALLVVFLLAVARVDIHFSRQGMNNIQVAPLTVASLYFTLRAIHKKSINSAFISGMIAGAGIYSYFSARFILLIMGCLFLFAIVVKEHQHWRIYASLGLASAIAAAIVAAPMLGYYLADLHRFYGHARGNLWMNNLAHVTSGDPTITIPMIWLSQLDRTFWGFNLYKDSSGQYGADATILDPATAILFFIGLAICLWQWKKTGYFMLLVWYVVTNVLAGLIVVGPPNAPRLISLLPALCLMAGIAIQCIWDIGKQSDLRTRTLVGVLAFAFIPTYAFASNYFLYFQKYAQIHRCEPQTEIGRYLAARAPDATAYGIGAELDVGSAIIRLLAPSVRGQAVGTWEDILPVRHIPESDVFFFAGNVFAPTMNFVREYYPSGTLYEMRHPDGRLLFLAYRVSREDITGYIGLVGRYSSLGDDSQIVERRDALLSFQWNTDLPQGIGMPFSVRWEGSLFAPVFGSYRLRLEGDGEAMLSLDNALVLKMTPGGQPTEVSLMMAKGWHRLSLDYVADGGSLRLLWQQPGRGMEVIAPEFLSTQTVIHGLLASYYRDLSTEQPPVYQAIEPALFTQTRTFAQLFGWGTPYISVGSGTITVPETGSYTFAATALEGIFTLKIDGETMLTFGPKVHELQRATRHLSQGDHRIELSFTCPEGRFQRIQMWWAPPGQELQPVPPTVLSPDKP